MTLAKNAYRGFTLKEEGGRVHVLNKDGQSQGDFASELEATQWIDSKATGGSRNADQASGERYGGAGDAGAGNAGQGSNPGA